MFPLAHFCLFALKHVVQGGLTAKKNRIILRLIVCFCSPEDPVSAAGPACRSDAAQEPPASKVSRWFFTTNAIPRAAMQVALRLQSLQHKQEARAFKEAFPNRWVATYKCCLEQFSLGHFVVPFFSIRNKKFQYAHFLKKMIN